MLQTTPGGHGWSDPTRLIAPPAISAFVHGKPRNIVGAFHVLACAAGTALAIWLSLSAELPVWLLGQVLLAFALLNWFVLLCEAGHRTLFRTRWLNSVVGEVAGWFVLVPYGCWKLAHSRGGVERVGCWKRWPGVVALRYRAKCWDLPRLYRDFPHSHQRRRITGSILLLGAVYGTTTYLAGELVLLQVMGLSMLLCLAMQDGLGQARRRITGSGHIRRVVSMLRNASGTSLSGGRSATGQ